MSVSERSASVAWDDDSTIYEYNDDWETGSQSHRSIASAPVNLNTSSVRKAVTTTTTTTRRMQGDLRDIQDAISISTTSRGVIDDDNNNNSSSSRTKCAIAILVTIVMMISTVRIRSEESRMAMTLTSAEKVVLTSAMVSQSYERAGFSSTSQSLDSVGISKSLKYLANVSAPVANNTNDVPFFFHVPRSGGSTIKDILGSCYNMAEATDVGGRSIKTKSSSSLRTTTPSPPSLQIIHSEDGAAYVNVDTSTAEGIQKARTMGLVESRLADVIISQHLHPASTLFNADQRGRCFTMMRSPIDRAVSMFHYLSVANWEPTYDPSLAYISIEMYARSKRAEHNWMTRFLSNELERDLNEKHLEIAKKVLRDKCVVGLLEQKEESFLRFEKYFGWAAKNQKEVECRDRLLHWGWSNKHSHPQVEEGSVVWDLLYKKNSYDMQLYQFVKELFNEQGASFHSDDNAVSAAEASTNAPGVAVTIKADDES